MDFVDKPACKSQSVRYYVIVFRFDNLDAIGWWLSGEAEPDYYTILYATSRSSELWIVAVDSNATTRLRRCFE